MDLSERPAHPFHRHPWELARFRFFRALLRDAGADRRPQAILDVGAGDAWFASRLLGDMPAGTRITCWDASYTVDDVARLTAGGSGAIQFSAEPPTGRFSLLLLLDVLEHVERDHEFLSALVEQRLEPGALVVISVPAWTALYNDHDAWLRHHRRYAPAGAARLVADAGLAIVRRGGLFHSLILPRYLGTLLRRRQRTAAAHSLEWRSGAATARLLEEAVRRGLREALEGGATTIGYVDADLSTPVPEVLRLLAEMERRHAVVVMGARVALLGTAIARRAHRHYLGRLFATAASLVLGVRVYDTQCGAKFFRDTPAVRHALATPFASRWAFDVELIGRLLQGDPPLRPADFVEIPLQRWTDVSGSKIGPLQMVRTAWDLAVIAVRYHARKRVR